MRDHIRLWLISLCAILAAGAAAAGDFAPVKIVNDQVISGYELRQRIDFLTLLRQPGDIRNEAVKGLIEDRLRNAAAKAAGISLTADEVLEGMTEFAGRANLSADEFVAAIGNAGVAPETFRDFVSAGLAWRKVVRQKFDGKIIISEAAIDRALAQFSIPLAQQVTLAEIVLPASGAQRSAALAAARELRIDLMRGRDFAEAARSLSIGPTARSGGVLAAQNLSALPEATAQVVRALQEGAVSAPVILDDQVAIYKMIASAQEPTRITAPTQVDYAEVAGGADLRGKVDSCDDLYAHSASVVRRSVPIGAAGDVAAALQLLDAGEQTVISRAGVPVLVMLCSRGAPLGSQPSRDEVRLILTNQRLGALASVYLEELRSDALIIDP